MDYIEVTVRTFKGPFMTTEEFVKKPVGGVKPNDVNNLLGELRESLFGKIKGVKDKPVEEPPAPTEPPV